MRFRRLFPSEGGGTAETPSGSLLAHQGFATADKGGLQNVPEEQEQRGLLSFELVKGLGGQRMGQGHRSGSNTEVRW